MKKIIKNKNHGKTCTYKIKDTKIKHQAKEKLTVQAKRKHHVDDKKKVLEMDCKKNNNKNKQKHFQIGFLYIKMQKFIYR